MKIIIYQNREVYKEESKIGNDSENKVETLEFEFPEEYADFTKYIEFQIKGEKYVDLVEGNKYVITREVAKYGKIKTQVVLKKNTENDVMVFKSDIFTLNVSNSINATENLVNTVGIDLIEKIVGKNYEQDVRLDTLEADSTNNIENISNLQNDNTTNKTNIKSLQDDNEVNKTDISNIKQEQTVQNTNIQELQTDNTSNKSKIADLETKNAEQDTNIQKNTDDIEEINQKDTTQDNLIEELQTEIVELKSENTTLKNQIPSGEEVGNPIHISDSSDMECEIVPIANTEQATREGYNLLDLSGFTPIDKNGVVATKNEDGSITLNGTCTVSFGIYVSINKTLSIGSYTHSIGVPVPAEVYISLDNTSISMINNSTESKKTFEITEETLYDKYLIWINAGAILSNLTIYPMIYKGTDDKPYEPYGASPSPDYPSPVKTVGQNGSVEIKVDNGLETTDTNYKSYTKVLPIQKEFVKIGDYEDTFVKVDGKWYEAHYSSKYIFTGNETVDIQNSTNGFYSIRCLSGMRKLSYNAGMSNIGTIRNNWSELNNYDNSIALTDYGNNGFYEWVWIHSSALKEKTAQEVQQILKDNYVIYPLETPELIPCTAEQSAILNSFYTYKGVTNVSMSGIGKIKIIYKQDQQTINKNYENRLAALEAAIIS